MKSPYAISLSFLENASIVGTDLGLNEFNINEAALIEFYQIL